MGIAENRILYVEKPTQFRSVTIPDQAQQMSHSFTKEFLLPYQAIKSRVTPGKNKKIYLTRREHQKRVFSPKHGMIYFSEKYFEDFFTAHGFKVFATDTLPSIEEEISLIMGADEIATAGISLAHWVSFFKPTAKFIMLLRKKDLGSSHQCMLMEAFNFRNYYIVDGSHNFMYAGLSRGANMLGSNKYWREFVADYFNEQIEEDYAYLTEALDRYVEV